MGTSKVIEMPDSPWRQFHGWPASCGALGWAPVGPPRRRLWPSSREPKTLHKFICPWIFKQTANKEIFQFFCLIARLKKNIFLASILQRPMMAFCRRRPQRICCEGKTLRHLLCRENYHCFTEFDHIALVGELRTLSAPSHEATCHCCK